MAAGAAVLVMLLPGLREAASALTLFADASGLDGGAALILRVAGVSLIAEFATHLCEDAGEKALASRVELAVRVTLFARTHAFDRTGQSGHGGVGMKMARVLLVLAVLLLLCTPALGEEGGTRWNWTIFPRRWNKRA